MATLLHEDAAVRTAAASLTFDVAAALQKSRVNRLRGGAALVAIEEDEECEAELVSAVLEALSKEVQSEEVGMCCFSLSALLNVVLRGEYWQFIGWLPRLRFCFDCRRRTRDSWRLCSRCCSRERL